MRLSRGDIAVAMVLTVFGLGFVISRATLREAAQAKALTPAPDAPTAASPEEANEAPGPSAGQAPAENPPGTPAAGAAAAEPAGDSTAAADPPVEKTEEAGPGEPAGATEPAQPPEIEIYAEQTVPAAFGIGEAAPRSFSADALAQLGRSFRDCPGTITVTGHTDASGDRGENTRISLDRARFVQAMLIQQGIPADRIALEGIGGGVPIASNSTSEGRMRNRRVTIVCAR
jgi:peptidoglycan-binding protein ArfA